MQHLDDMPGSCAQPDLSMTPFMGDDDHDAQMTLRNMFPDEEATGATPAHAPTRHAKGAISTLSPTTTGSPVVSPQRALPAPTSPTTRSKQMASLSPIAPQTPEALLDDETMERPLPRTEIPHGTKG
eukprot:7727751-Pyramimonas_sp.AAC.1